MRHILFSLALVCAAPALAAQGVYRSVMPDGQIVYGSKPEPGAKESSPMNLPPPNISAPTPRATPAPPPPPGTDRDSIRNLQQALDDAKKALENGREPLENERIGVASKGSSRLNDAYYQRIKGLENAITAAQAKLDAAERGAR
jgi:hypothetical protein